MSEHGVAVLAGSRVADGAEPIALARQYAEIRP